MNRKKEETMKAMRWLLLAMAVMAASSCATARRTRLPSLRVGATLNYPPVIQRANESVSGVEADFAEQLSRELGRKLEWVVLPWEALIDELEAGRIDIVMSGMTATPARKVRAAFCDSYMENPLVVVVRRGEAGGYAVAEDVVGAVASVGVLKGTAADAYVRKKFARAKAMGISQREDVAFYLSNQRIDLYVDDLAAAVDIVARNETRLELVRVPLSDQELAWAVRLDDKALLSQANEVLAGWRASGFLDQVLERWMPYRKYYAAAAEK